VYGSKSQEFPSGHANANAHTHRQVTWTSAFSNLFKSNRTRSKTDLLSDKEVDEYAEDEIRDFSTTVCPSNAVAPFDLVPLDIRLRMEVHSVDICSTAVLMEDKAALKQFLLIATDRGLYAADVSNHHQDGEGKSAIALK
jgi:hypothetical protein